MLLRFATGNFLSFKEVQEFKMAAGKIRRHGNHVYETKTGKRILKGGLIFGANAAGKSNLVSAIDMAKRAVLKGTNIGDWHKKYFRIDNAYKDKPGLFQFDIYTGGHFYSYGFTLSYGNAEIEGEWLYCIDDNEVCIFERYRTEDGKMEVNSDLRFDDPKEKNRFDVYREAIDSDDMKQKMFLTDIARRSNRNSDVYKAFRDVRKWFAKLIVIYPTTRYANAVELAQNDKARIVFEQYLKSFDTGIETLSGVARDFDKVFNDLPEQVRASIKEDILSSDNKGRKVQLTVNINDSQHYDLSLIDGNILVTEVLSSHGNPNDLFEFADESDGTRRLFDLLPVFQVTRTNRVVIIDELDRSLHTRATLEFIRRFYEEAENYPSQLIATTHDTNLLDLNILRQDEIWFIERLNDHSSRLIPLSCYNPRFDKEVKRDYLIGRYGAVPIFDRLPLLEGEEGADNEW